MKLLYKPFGLILGLIAGFIGKKVFDKVWSMIDDEEPPKATTQRVTWPKVIAAAALQGAIFRGTRAAIDRGGAEGWSHLFGVWPGEKEQEPADD
jgi:uncharacterized protein DUF4235